MRCPDSQGAKTSMLPSYTHPAFGLRPEFSPAAAVAAAAVATRRLAIIGRFPLVASNLQSIGNLRL